ncbi:hypothetical protein C2E23DRAFT_388617 [Lenzites betulinus]|nr:hypothetical protein C2E23DRAFT_388617 [Lenzites betulinus]
MDRRDGLAFCCIGWHILRGEHPTSDSMISRPKLAVTPHPVGRQRHPLSPATATSQQTDMSPPSPGLPFSCNTLRVTSRAASVEYASGPISLIKTSWCPSQARQRKLFPTARHLRSVSLILAASARIAGVPPIAASERTHPCPTASLSSFAQWTARKQEIAHGADVHASRPTSRRTSSAPARLKLKQPRVQGAWSLGGRGVTSTSRSWGARRRRGNAGRQKSEAEDIDAPRGLREEVWKRCGEHECECRGGGEKAKRERGWMQWDGVVVAYAYS